MSAPSPNTKTASDSSMDVAPETKEADVTTGLNDLLANATVFYQKVRHYHWNVTGPHFFTLHDEFWNDAIDEIAEQVRSRGDRPVHTLADVLDLASLAEDPSTPAAEEMVEAVTEDLAALDDQVQPGRPGGGRRRLRRGHHARGPQRADRGGPLDAACLAQ